MEKESINVAWLHVLQRDCDMARRVRPWLNQRRAFTLVELIAVMAITAVISGFVLGVGRSAGTTGRIARARAELTVLEAGLESYRRVFGDYPRTDRAEDLLQSLLGRRGPTGAPLDTRVLVDLALVTLGGAADPFADDESRVVDPWGQPYRYAYKTTVPWTPAGFVLFSGGPDEMTTAGLSDGRVDEAAAANQDNVYASR